MIVIWVLNIPFSVRKIETVHINFCWPEHHERFDIMNQHPLFITQTKNIFSDYKFQYNPNINIAWHNLWQQKILIAKITVKKSQLRWKAHILLNDIFHTTKIYNSTMYISMPCVQYVSNILNNMSFMYCAVSTIDFEIKFTRTF